MRSPYHRRCQINNRFIFGVVGGGLGSRRRSRVRTIRLWVWSYSRQALGVVELDRLVHRALLLPSTAS